jgi:uncharacterized protein
MSETIKIGIISDTHGFLPTHVHQLFKGVDRIIHAGDIGDAFIVPELQSIAPTIAIYGNVDGDSFRKRFKHFESLRIFGFLIQVFHIPWQFPQTTQNADNLIRISGHTHTPRIYWENDVLNINPGSTTLPRKITQPSVALLKLTNEQKPDAEILFF